VGHSLPQVLQRRSEEAWAVSATADPGRESFTLENGLPSALGIPVVSSLPRNGVFVFVVATVSLLFLRCTFAKSRNFKRRQPQDRELPSRLRATRPQLSRAKDRRQYLQRKLKSGAIPRVGWPCGLKDRLNRVGLRGVSHSPAISSTVISSPRSRHEERSIPTRLVSARRVVLGGRMHPNAEVQRTMCRQSHGHVMGGRFLQGQDYRLRG